MKIKTKKRWRLPNQVMDISALGLSVDFEILDLDVLGHFTLNLFYNSKL